MNNFFIFDKYGDAILGILQIDKTNEETEEIINELKATKNLQGYDLIEYILRNYMNANFIYYNDVDVFWL